MVRIMKGGRSADYAARNERNQMDWDGLNDPGNDRKQKNDVFGEMGWERQRSILNLRGSR